MSDTRTTPTAHARIQADLVDAARRMIAGRRRRRRTALIVLAIAGLLGTTTATAALSGYTTGVPAIDDMLSAIHERRPAMSPPSDLRPGLGGASPPLEFSWPDGDDRDGVAVAYVSRHGMICFARARAEEPERGGTGCASHRLLTARLREAPAFVSGGGGDSPAWVSVYGFARDDVESVEVDWPGGGGAARATLTEAWSPFADDRRIKAFAAFVKGRLRPPRPGRPFPFPRAVEATLSDGRVVDLRPASRPTGAARRP